MMKKKSKVNLFLKLIIFTTLISALLQVIRNVLPFFISLITGNIAPEYISSFSLSIGNLDFSTLLDVLSLIGIFYIAKKESKKALKVFALILMGVIILIQISVFFDLSKDYFLFLLFLIGVVNFIFGIFIFGLRERFGKLAIWFGILVLSSGILQVGAGIFSSLTFLDLSNFFYTIATILEVILFYRVIKTY